MENKQTFKLPDNLVTETLKELVAEEYYVYDEYNSFTSAIIQLNNINDHDEIIIIKGVWINDNDYIDTEDLPFSNLDYIQTIREATKEEIETYFK